MVFANVPAGAHPQPRSLEAGPTALHPSAQWHVRPVPPSEGCSNHASACVTHEALSVLPRGTTSRTAHRPPARLSGGVGTHSSPWVGVQRVSGCVPQGRTTSMAATSSKGITAPSIPVHTHTLPPFPHAPRPHGQPCSWCCIQPGAVLACRGEPQRVAADLPPSPHSDPSPSWSEPHPSTQPTTPIHEQGNSQGRKKDNAELRRRGAAELLC